MEPAEHYSESNLNWSDYYNGHFFAHYTRLQPTVLLRNIRANRNVSNKAACFGDEKKRKLGFSTEQKQKQTVDTHCSIKLVNVSKRIFKQA